MVNYSNRQRRTPWQEALRSAATPWTATTGSGEGYGMRTEMPHRPHLLLNPHSLKTPPSGGCPRHNEFNGLIATVIFWACRNRDCCRPDQSPQTHAVPTSDRLEQCELETQDAVYYPDLACERSRNAHRRRLQT